MQLLSYGSRGAAVQAAQLALCRAGFLYGSTAPDGIYGSQTQAAVMRFQRAMGLTPDGITGPATWRALRPYLTGYRTHIVAPGDTFYKLAQRYGTTATAIAMANPTVNPYNLSIGRPLTVPFPFDVVSSEIPVTSALCVLYAEGIAARYPAAQVASVGSSVLGQPLLRIRLGEGGRRVACNASHHANEWITTLVVLRYTEQFAKAAAYGTRIGGADAAALLQGVSFDFYPLVNPDGVDLVTGMLAPDSEAYQSAQALAAAYPSVSFPGGWKANIAGVDLNLNYPASWEKAQEIKFEQGYTAPGPRDYVGPFPLSEPESRAMAACTQAGDYALTLSYHTQGNVIYWKYADAEPPRSYEIGRRLAAVSGYTLEITPPESANAGYRDWFILTFDRPGYTVECGTGVNPLPLGQLDAIYRANAPLITEAARLA